MRSIKHIRDRHSHAESIYLDSAKCHTHAQVTTKVYFRAAREASQGAKEYEEQKGSNGDLLHSIESIVGEITISWIAARDTNPQHKS